ncbi:MAG: hypothetical protein SPI12_05730 [Actinomycetaceae bacterium]|nr:hypothetical protein [Actinomycetaceae bacterium]MDY6083337.1 hypothetical protein [Actinomycetaceae bacterium]
MDVKKAGKILLGVEFLYSLVMLAIAAAAVAHAGFPSGLTVTVIVGMCAFALWIFGYVRRQVYVVAGSFFGVLLFCPSPWPVMTWIGLALGLIVLSLVAYGSLHDEPMQW